VYRSAAVATCLGSFLDISAGEVDRQVLHNGAPYGTAASLGEDGEGELATSGVGRLVSGDGLIDELTPSSSSVCSRSSLNYS